MIILLVPDSGFERAKVFADSWGSVLINMGDVGHINAASGIGEWP